ncbi:MAG: MCP four helix bundle domain-containing protein, partial [Helicobacteraceae bacterium]|nr:MCP four helix bundle domain-containing protein [Helicobacteraceae bacterium]
MQVKTRLITLISIGLAGVFLTAMIGYINALRDEAAMEDIYENRLKSIMTVEKFALAVSEITKRNYHIAAVKTLNDEDEITMSHLAMNMREQALKEALEHVANYETFPMTPNVERIWNEFKDVWRKWHDDEMETTKFISEKFQDGSTEAIDQAQVYIAKKQLGKLKLNTQLSSLVNSLANEDYAIGEIVYKEAADSTKNMIVVEFVALFVMIIALLAVARSTFNAVVKPIAKARDVVVQVAADQNLKLRVDHTSNDEIGEMVAA